MWHYRAKVVFAGISTFPLYIKLTEFAKQHITRHTEIQGLGQVFSHWWHLTWPNFTSGFTPLVIHVILTTAMQNQEIQIKGTVHQQVNSVKRERFCVFYCRCAPLKFQLKQPGYKLLKTWQCLCSGCVEARGARCNLCNRTCWVV